MWSNERKINGVKVALQPCNGVSPAFGGTKGGIIGFFVEDEKTAQLIAGRDPLLFDVLEIMFRDFADIAIAMWASDPCWWHKGSHISEDAYLERLRALESSNYATDAMRTRATRERQCIEQARARKRKKGELTKRRRTQFSAKRDALALALIERDGFSCKECGGVEDLTIDHIIPLSKGGTDDLDNLRWLCRSCNSKKGDR